MNVKNFLKKIYYGVNNIAFPQGMQLNTGFIFHTEEIFNPAIHQALVRFCKEYQLITGTQCICVTMTPPNKRVEKGMREFGCTNQEYINRMQELAAVAHIGFHGHFWHDPEKFEDAAFDIRKNNTSYNHDVLCKQFEDQINWFYENNISHNNTYSGGWWFLNKDLIELLAKQDIRYDYTVSMSPNLWNPFTTRLVKENNIDYGETFFTSINNKKLLHVQNLHCGHDTPFPQDATRFMNTLIQKNAVSVTGVLNSHDYSVDYDNTIRWIRYLKAMPGVKFLNHRDFIQVPVASLKIIAL